MFQKRAHSIVVLPRPVPAHTCRLFQITFINFLYIFTLTKAHSSHAFIYKSCEL